MDYRLKFLPLKGTHRLHQFFTINYVGGFPQVQPEDKQNCRYLFFVMESVAIQQLNHLLWKHFVRCVVDFTTNICGDKS